MKSHFAPWTLPGRRDACTIRSPDGVAAVTIGRAGEGVFVERTLQRPGRARVVQATVFTTAEDFRRWCDADALRFDYPLISHALIRHADELFNRHESTDAIG